MANFASNIAKGRAVEWYYRVENNDPGTANFALIPLSTATTAAEAQDYATVTAFLGGTANEQTAGGWVRKPLTDTQLAAFPAPDNTNDRYDVAVPAVTWTTPTAGNNIQAVLLAFNYTADATSAANDGTSLPVSHHDLVFVADGLNFVLNLSTFWRAT